MQGFERADRQLLDAAALAGHLVPAGGMFAFLAAHRAGALADPDLAKQAASAVALLALVAGQDVEPAEGSDGRDGRWRIARKVAEDRVISVNDPGARHTRKSTVSRPNH